MTSAEEPRALVVPVVMDGWQLGCCGDPPGVGDVVTWRLRWDVEEVGLLPTDLDLEASVEVFDPGDDDPTYGAASTAGAVEARVPVLASYESLRVFSTATEPVPHRLRLRGVLHEDHHVSTPLNLPTTTGTIRAVNLLSFDHDQVPGHLRRWAIVPGTGRLEPVSRSPRWLPDDEPAEGRTTGWRPGPSMVLVDLELTTPSPRSRAGAGCRSEAEVARMGP